MLSAIRVVAELIKLAQPVSINIAAKPILILAILTPFRPKGNLSLFLL
jgi:hypothetical protein